MNIELLKEGKQVIIKPKKGKWIYPNNIVSFDDEKIVYKTIKTNIYQIVDTCDNSQINNEELEEHNILFKDILEIIDKEKLYSEID